MRSIEHSHGPFAKIVGNDSVPRYDPSAWSKIKSFSKRLMGPPTWNVKFEVFCSPSWTATNFVLRGYFRRPKVIDRDFIQFICRQIVVQQKLEKSFRGSESYPLWNTQRFRCRGAPDARYRLARLPAGVGKISTLYCLNNLYGEGGVHLERVGSTH